MYKKIDLNNGLRIILNHMPRMESASVGVWIATGSRNEDKHLSGISHFLEHMVFKGTSTRSGRKVKEEIEGRGGSLNGFTSEEITCYLAKVSSHHLLRTLDVLSDMVLNASMNQRDIEVERTVIMEEIKMYKDLPNYYVRDILDELMWPGHPLGLSIAGTIESVSSIDRRAILDYKRATYIPEKIVLVLCGKIDRDAVVRKIKRIFNSNVQHRPAPFIEFNNTQSEPQMKVLYKPTEQTHLAMGLHTFGRMDEARHTLALLHIILGANMSSRLFENLREKKGLAYEIGTEVKRFREAGAFIINAGIEHSKIKEAVGLIIKELRKIKHSAVRENELKRAKEFYKVQLLLALEDTLDHMLWLGEHVVALGKLPSKKEIIKKVDSVSPLDLQRVAKSIFRDNNLNLALIGSIRDRERNQIEHELEL